MRTGIHPRIKSEGMLRSKTLLGPDLTPDDSARRFELQPGAGRTPALFIFGTPVSVRLRNAIGSGVRRAADVDHVAVTDRGILVDETGDHHAAVEGNDLPVLVAAGGSGRADIVLAAR